MRYGLPESDWKINSVIYLITNTINGKGYVGQTYKTLALRYKRTWWRGINNQILARAVAKYGADKFVFSIIESSVPHEQLNEKEKFYIDKLKTLSPLGYNMKPGGDNHSFSDETRAIMSKNRRDKHRKNFSLVKDEEICNFTSIAEFCEIQKLARTAICAVLNGKHRHHHGWHLPTTDLRFRYKKEEIRYLYKDDKEYEVCCVATFAREHNLNEACIHSLFAKRFANHRGFHIKEPPKIKINHEWDTNPPIRYTRVVLRNIKTNELLIVPRKDRMGFKRSTGIDFYALLKGIQKTSGGFALYEVDEK